MGRIPVAARSDAGQWSTFGIQRRILIVVHTVTALTRILDLLPVLAGDRRVQILFTTPATSTFHAGVADALRAREMPFISWDDALSIEFDLAITASFGGDLHRINAPLIALPHGAGYTKFTKYKVQSTKSVFGLGREQLTHQGRVYLATVALSHEEQREQLAHSCPEALAVAEVVGDPCYDRLLVSARRREFFRQEFGVQPGQRLLVLTSTWGPGSLLGRRPDIAEQLLAELPMDDYRLAAVLHPNVWHGHGPWQVRSWLAKAERAGLMLVPPEEGWRAALIAGDLIIGDHGSVTVYGAALGRPVALGAFAHEDLDPSCPTAELGRILPGLIPERPVKPQLEAILAAHDARRITAITDRVLGHPMESYNRLTSLFYRLMALPPPSATASPSAVPGPVVNTRGTSSAVVFAEADSGQATVELVRFPARLSVADVAMEGAAHIAATTAEPDLHVLESAAVMVRPGEEGVADAAIWAERTLQDYPAARLAISPVGPGRCLVMGSRLSAVCDYEPMSADLMMVGSAVYAWLDAGGAIEGLKDGVNVHAGSISLRVFGARP